MAERNKQVYQANIELDNILKISNSDALSLKNKVLFVLSEAGKNGMTPKDLMNKLNLIKTNLATICKQLEQEDLIEKIKEKKDGRNIKVFISKRGLKHLEELEDLIDNNLKTNLNKIEYKELCFCCDRINSILNKTRS